MPGHFSHIGVVVRDLEKTIERFCAVLGAKVIERGHLAASNTDVAVLDLGGVHLELLSSTEAGSKVGRLLAERGEGIHHISFEVDNIRDKMASLEKGGIGLVDKVPRPGLHGRQIAFLAAQDTAGILIELAEEVPHSKEKA